MTHEEFKTLSSRHSLYVEIMNLYPLYLARFPQTKFVEILYARYRVPECRLMTREDLTDLIRFLKSAVSKECA